MKFWTLIALLALTSACAANPARFADDQESAEETEDAEKVDTTEQAVEGQPPEANLPGQKHRHHGGDKHVFKNPEERAKSWNSTERDAWQKPEEVLGVMKVEPGMTVADIGTGTGYFIPHLSGAVGPTGQV